MISVFKIHDTILKVTYEAQTLVPLFPVIRNEHELLSELVLCILSSQEKYEVALAVMKEFQKHNVLRIPKDKAEFRKLKPRIHATLKKPVVFKMNKKECSRRLRFYVKKAQYIAVTIENIYLNDLTIKKILKHKDCIQETRKNIINHTYGLGPKQASMFLRNIGYYSDFALLDKAEIN